PLPEYRAAAIAKAPSARAAPLSTHPAPAAKAALRLPRQAAGCLPYRRPAHKKMGMRRRKSAIRYRRWAWASDRQTARVRDATPAHALPAPADQHRLAWLPAIFHPYRRRRPAAWAAATSARETSGRGRMIR